MQVEDRPGREPSRSPGNQNHDDRDGDPERPRARVLAKDNVFSPREFTQLQNAQAIVLPYDGINPLPAQFCYLKPYYVNVERSYFDHLEMGAL